MGSCYPVSFNGHSLGIRTASSGSGTEVQLARRLAHPLPSHCMLIQNFKHLRSIVSGKGSRSFRQYLEASVTPRAQAIEMPAVLEKPLHTLEDFQMESSFTDELPGDPVRTNGLRQVDNAFYSFVSPTPTRTEPRLVIGSTEVAQLIGLDPAEFDRPEFAQIFSGNAQLPASDGKSYAQCYGGHQFGSWAGQLGDGRAINLGEARGPDGRRWDLQLKGAGLTPYSRRADGRAVMRSSLREYVASEAMAALGVPTTRALSLVATGDRVLRDMFYNGNAKFEPGAVVCRVAPSFIRFGTFQLPVSRGEEQVGLVKQLADYVIRHHYTHLDGRKDKYAALLMEVSKRTGSLIAFWQNVGFVHGVLNTDNMSILGETIDYGPYGFLGPFDPSFTPNTTDLPRRRYCFRQQPEIGQWNLAQLANALLAAQLMTLDEAQAAVEAFLDTMLPEYEARGARKMGLKSYNKDLAVGLLTTMYEDRADFTNTYRALSSVSTSEPDEAIPEALSKALGELSEERRGAWSKWLAQYRAALRAEGLPDKERQAMQDSVNPAYIPRNHVLLKVIADVEEGNFSELNTLMDLLKTPYQERPGFERFCEPAPGGEARLGVELLSCSS
eukprot:jgi/Botrbrau1/5609/Bobra.97_2s0032.1